MIQSTNRPKSPSGFLGPPGPPGKHEKAQVGPSQAYIRQADWSSFHGGFLECLPGGSWEMRLCEEPQSMEEQFGSRGPSDGVRWWGADEVNGLHCALAWSWSLSFLSPDRTTRSKCVKDVGPLKLGEFASSPGASNLYPKSFKLCSC